MVILFFDLSTKYLVNKDVIVYLFLPEALAQRPGPSASDVGTRPTQQMTSSSSFDYAKLTTPPQVSVPSPLLHEPAVATATLDYIRAIGRQLQGIFNFYEL